MLTGLGFPKRTPGSISVGPGACRSQLGLKFVELTASIRVRLTGKTQELYAVQTHESGRNEPHEKNPAPMRGGTVCGPWRGSSVLSEPSSAALRARSSRPFPSGAAVAAIVPPPEATPPNCSHRDVLVFPMVLTRLLTRSRLFSSAHPQQSS